MNLGRQHQALPLAGSHQRAAEDLLAAPAAVDVGGIDAVDSRLERALNQRYGFSLVGLTTKEHGTEAEFADLHAGSAQAAIFHEFLLLFKTMEPQQRGHVVTLCATISETTVLQATFDMD